jgi:hypothetical protein
MSFSRSHSDRQTDSDAGAEPKKEGDDGGEIALEGFKLQNAEDSEQDEEKNSELDESRSKVHGVHDEESAIGYLGDGGTTAGVETKGERKGAAIVG